MRLRRRAAGLVVGALVLFIVGTNVQAGWLFVIAALLLGAVVTGVALPSRMVRGIEVSRRAPERAHQGDAVAVELIVTNRARGMRASLFVRDPFLADIEVFVSHLAPGERVELTTERVAARRGTQGADAVVLRCDAPFAVAERRRRIDATGSALVLPRVELLGDLPFVDRAPTRERAIHSLPRRGQGPEYLGIREYRPGDGMRHVHWPSTARHGSVMVRELEEETTRRLGIVVDTLTDAGQEWTPLDAACSAAASVAMAAAARGQGVRLATVLGNDADVMTRPAQGELLAHLAELEPNGWSLATTVQRLGGAMRGMESALVILPTWRANDADATVPAVAELATGIGLVAALLVDAESRGAPSQACLRQTEITTLIRALSDVGAEPYHWTQGEELAEVFAREAVGV